MNSLLLEMKMKQKKINNEYMAKVLGIDPVTFYRKRKGLSDFTRREIQIIRKELDLTPKEVDSIFFDEKLT